MIINRYAVLEFVAVDGRCPYREWLATLPIVVVARLDARIVRVEQGNLGDWKNVGHGVNELIFQFGAGYRIYFGFERQKVLILLGGGVKGSQRRDILRAREYWLDYQRRG